MNGKLQSIHLHLNAGAPQDDLAARDFQETPVVECDNAELTFYTKERVDGTIVGSVQVSADDRKATGALVGNWIAAGFVVNRLPYKKLAAALRKQSAVDATKDDPSAPASASSAAPSAATPGTPGAPAGGSEA